MADAVLALASVFCGCQANVFLLELITVGSPNTLYILTFVQYLIVAIFSLPLVCTFGAEQDKFRWIPVRLRPTQIVMSHKIALAFSAWLTSVGSNIVFGLHISIPLHATFRSSALLLNMLAGYLFLEKHYTVPQVLCAIIISGGLITLAVEKSRKFQSYSGMTGTLTPEEYFWWVCGLLILAFTTIFSTGLGIFQEYIYREAQRRQEDKKKSSSLLTVSSSPPPMWAETLFFSHVLATPLFLLQPQRLFKEFLSISAENYTHFILNAITQYVCVAGVYMLNNKTSAFTLILVLTLRKLCTFVLSVVYFKHYQYFSPIEWAAMIAAMTAGTLYPLLPKSQYRNQAEFDSVKSKKNI